MTNSHPSFFAGLALWLCAPAAAQEILDGVYAVTQDAVGIEIEPLSGGTMTLGKLLTPKLGSASITSTGNGNRTFRIRLPAAGPVPAGAEKQRLAIHVGGRYLLVSSYSRKGDRLSLLADIPDRKAASAIAKRLGTKLRLRNHPGHQLDARLRPKKAKYSVGEPIVVVMEIRNVGKAPFTFTDGGMNRGARNNQFDFLARAGYGFGKGVPDTGDPLNRGGLAVRRTLQPGQTFEKEARLERWFRFDRPDSYRITGLFRLQIGETKDWLLRWDDFAVGECLVQIVPKAKAGK